MKIGIVGSEQSKFTELTEQLARQCIRTILTQSQATHVISGACHLGGVDTFAAQEGRFLGLTIIEYPPSVLAWGTPSSGFQGRNIQIAQTSDEVYCITVDVMPPWGDKVFCYHCKSLEHVKSGGCWTARHAKRLGKPAAIYVVSNDGTLRVDEVKV